MCQSGGLPEKLAVVRECESMSREEEYRMLFFEETREHLEKMEAFLLELEKEPGVTDNINDLFRSVHTIKGSSAAMGFLKTSELVHKMEDIIQAVRDGRSEMTQEKTELFLKVYDHLAHTVDVLSNDGSEDSLDTRELLEALAAVQENKKMPEKQNPIEQVKLAVQEGILLGTEECAAMEISRTAGKALLGVYVKTLSDSAFKSVRAWMAIDEVQKHGDIIAGSPTKEQLDAFMKKGGETPPEAVSLITSTLLSLDELERCLLAELSEVELLYLEELRYDKGILLGDYLLFDSQRKLYCFDEQAIAFSKLDLSSVLKDGTQAMMLQGLDEIIRTTKDLEIMLLDMCPNLQECQKECNHVPHLITGLTGISETSQAIEKPLLARLADEGISLLTGVRSGGIKPSENILGLIANALNYIKKTARCLASNNDLPDGLEKEIEAHLEASQADVAAYIDKKMVTGHSMDQIENKKLCEILVDKGVLSESASSAAIDVQKTKMPDMKIGEILVKEEIADIANVRSAVANQEVARTPQPGNQYVRIAEYKVGSLFDLLGELIIMQSQQREDIQAVINGAGDSGRIHNNMTRMERVTKDIQAIAMTLRMVSVKQIFQKVLRVGMHTAKELNRDIRFILEGEETEVDRSIVEKLNDPLMHLIRNAISHGIEEDVAERTSAGKNPQGIVRMVAYSSKGFVIIEVSDDGKGLDTRRLLKKALEKGLALPDREYTEKEIIQFIFHPGFSTQEQVNSISGRGVGMNVVEEEIKSIGGRVEIKTEKGKGTSFVLKIPINMATINGIVVDICGQRYVLPTMSIKRIFKPEEEDWISIRGHVEMVRNRGELIQLVPIRKIIERDFDLEGHIVLVIEYEGDVRALPVKEVLGKQEIVIKPLDSAFSHLGFLAGSTIMGDGTAALILDIECFFRMCQ